MKNESSKWLLLAPDGRIVEGEAHPDGRMVLAAPGVDVPADYLRRYPGLAAALKAPAPEPEAKAVAAPPEDKAVAGPVATKAPEPKPAVQAGGKGGR